MVCCDLYTAITVQWSCYSRVSRQWFRHCTKFFGHNFRFGQHVVIDERLYLQSHDWRINSGKGKLLIHQSGLIFGCFEKCRCCSNLLDRFWSAKTKKLPLFTDLALSTCTIKHKRSSQNHWKNVSRIDQVKDRNVSVLKSIANINRIRSLSRYYNFRSTESSNLSSWDHSLTHTKWKTLDVLWNPQNYHFVRFFNSTLLFFFWQLTANLWTMANCICNFGCNVHVRFVGIFNDGKWRASAVE